MSASPAGHTPGRTPNGGNPPIIRRPRMADPLVRPNKKRRAPPQSTEPNGASSHDSKGELLHPQTAPKSLPNHLAKPKSLGARPSPPPHALLSGSGITTSGFSETPTQPYTDYPLVVTKRAFREGLRHHVARFASKQNVDPSDTNEFTRPVRLHRRDPRTTPGGPGGVKEEEEDGLPAEERERRDRERAEKAAQREADAAQIAPSADKGVSQRKIPFGKKVQTVYRNDQTEGKKAQSKLRYEEALPWHLEDFDNKSIWVGNYEDALSGRYAALSHGEDGVFRVTPLEKWYKFTPKNKFQSFTLDEAEKKMGAKVKQDRFGKEAQERKDRAAEEDRNRKLAQGFFVGKTGSANPNFKSENALADDLDFDEDRFADDEETPFMENTKDAEEKETEAKIKLEQLQANAFALRDEKEADRQEEVEQKVSENLKKVGKRVKKAIVKREKNYIYESDSGQDPYTESSESEDTETELAKAEERKKEEAKNATASDREKTRTSTGSSTRGTNTPSGRPSKHPLPTTKSSSSLKRPGSPNMSEASGNESSRKKHKKHNGLSSSQPIQPPSRPMSPNLAPPASSAPTAGKKHPRSNAGSGSEGEGARSGGEMSDGTKKRIKLKLGQPSRNGTPQMSRSGSPAAPLVRTGTPVNDTIAQGPLPTAQEIRSAIPAQGIRVADLISTFNVKGFNAEKKAQFTKLMKEASWYDGKAKLLKPKESE